MNAFVKIILVSHIEASQKNESNLLTAVQKRQLAVDLVVITRQRAGSDGKLAVFGSLSSSQLLSFRNLPRLDIWLFKFESQGNVRF